MVPGLMDRVEKEDLVRGHRVNVDVRIVGIVSHIRLLFPVIHGHVQNVERP